MTRKNYRDKQARRRHQVPWNDAETSSNYSVLMTNNSGVKRITVTGRTSVSAWNYAIRLGLNEDDPVMPGVWFPIEISLLGENDALFTAFTTL